MYEDEEATEDLAGQPDLSSEDLDDLALTISANMRLAKTDSADWRTMARECYDFAAGRQWSDEDTAILNEQRRPPVTFNRVSRTINAVVGLEVANRQEVRYIPRSNEDTGYNDMLTQAAKWVRDLCDAEDEETEAFTDLNICGMGWTETAMDYEEDPDGLVVIQRADPIGFFWDPSATRKNLKDARWIARVKLMSREDVLGNWPDYTGGGRTEEYLDNEDEPHDASPPYYDYEGQKTSNSKVKDIEVVHYQYYKKVEFVRVKSGDGMVEFEPKRFAKLRDRIEAMGLQHVTQKRRVYCYAYMIGGTVYEKEDLAVQDGGFTFQAMTGIRDRNNNSWFGLVSIMIDPQRWANKWLSQTMHIMNSNAKGGIMAEVGAFLNPRKAEKDWAKPDSFIELNAGGLAKIQERSMANFPQGVHELMQYAVESISDTPGINQELMGLVGEDRTGILESMRKQAGVTMLSVVFDALRLYRKGHGRLLAAFIRGFISDGRLVRVVGDQGAQYVPLHKDKINMQYDTIIDEAPTSHNQKEKVMQILMTLVPQMLQAGMPPPPPEVLEYLPVPESLIEKWMAQTRVDPQQQQMQMQQAEEERQVLLQERASKATLQKAQADKASAEAMETMRELQMPPVDPRAEALAEMQIQEMKARVAAETDIQVARINAMASAYIESMKIESSSVDNTALSGFEKIISSTEVQMNGIESALSQITRAVVESQQAVAELQRPKEKSVKVIRDANGDIIGAEVVESTVGIKAPVTLQ